MDTERMSSIHAPAANWHDLKLSEVMQSSQWTRGGTVSAEVVVKRVMPEAGQSRGELEELILTGRIRRIILLAEHKGKEYPIYILPLPRWKIERRVSLRSGNPIQTISRREGEIALGMVQLAKMIWTETEAGRPVKLSGLTLNILPANSEYRRPFLSHDLDVVNYLNPRLRRRVNLFVDTVQQLDSLRVP